MDECSIEGCHAPIKVKKFGLCGLHYGRLHRHGDPLAWKKPQRPTCSVPACELRAAAHGVCDTHYRRLKRYGTTELPDRPVECSAVNCDRGVQARGLCDKHYRRLVSFGEVEPERSCRQCGSSLEGLHIRRKFCNSACSQRWEYHERRRTHRERWLGRYGLTVAKYDEMVGRQDGKCAVCRCTEPKSNGGAHWCVDHDHATAQVRGLLCMDCNVGLGKFKDNPDLLAAAIRYLNG